MTDRTCGTCAWWDEMESHPGVGQCRYVAPTRVDDEAPWPLTGPADWCRHHATTRGWGEEQPKPVNDNDTSARDMRDVACFEAGVKSAKAEIARLKARCQNAREIIQNSAQKPGSVIADMTYRHWVETWMEASDDA